MGRRKQRERVFWRGGRAYGDFRDYADVRGDRERLIVKGEKLATRDRDVAASLANARLLALEAMRRNVGLTGRVGTPLAEYVAAHLSKKAKSKKVTADWLAQTELFLQRAVDHFGTDRDIGSISVEDVRGWADHLTTATNSHGRSFSPATQRKALNSLSHLYEWAQSEARVPIGYNPVALLKDKPVGEQVEARWLEVYQGALLLESARTLPAPSQATEMPAETLHALLATFLLTGGRKSEVAGLEVEDISFDRQTVTFRKNDWRRLKTLKSARVVPLWPQLSEVLRAYLNRQALDRPPSRLLFPSYVTGKEAMVGEWRRGLDRVAVRAGWKKGEIRTRIFRHTYCAARLQTLDGDAPVSPFTVGRELGHNSEAMVKEVYSHLGTVRHRAKVVEYRIEDFQEVLNERLEAMGIFKG